MRGQPRARVEELEAGCWATLARGSWLPRAGGCRRSALQAAADGRRRGARVGRGGACGRGSARCAAARPATRRAARGVDLEATCGGR